MIRWYSKNQFLLRSTHYKLNHPRCCYRCCVVQYQDRSYDCCYRSSSTSHSPLSLSAPDRTFKTNPMLLKMNDSQRRFVHDIVTSWYLQCTHQRRMVNTLADKHPTSITSWIGQNYYHHRGYFSTQAQMDDNSSSESATSTFVSDDVVDDNDDTDEADNDAVSSSDNANNNNQDDYFRNINLDDMDSLELPPNPDIPPPKVRTPYPIAPPPSTNYKPNHKSKNSHANDASSVLANERLVTQIMKNVKQLRHRANQPSSPGSHITADDIQVRVVPDPLVVKINKAIESTAEKQPAPTEVSTNINGSTTTTETATDAKKVKDSNKTKPVVMTLSEAIKMSIEQQKDLVEVSIDQEVPVITISNMKGIAYQSAKSKKSITGTNAASSQVKEVKMQAGIATNDLQRKVSDIFKFLDKGHMCIVSIRINRKQNRENSSAPEVAIERIVPLLMEEDKVEMVVPPEINPLRTTVSFRVRGKKK